MTLEERLKQVEEKRDELVERLDQFPKVGLDEGDRREIVGFGTILATIGAMMKEARETCALEEEPPPVLSEALLGCANAMKQIDAELSHAEKEAAAAAA